ncbi:MAG: hypothetical protein RMJ98_20945 [Myxococcales bacterium]|nr:hypothetical protein [Polyangiaceae bacterium]MDW8251771.1 hypothetical protein [Myxococcales bacterium]
MRVSWFFSSVLLLGLAASCATSGEAGPDGFAAGGSSAQGGSDQAGGSGGAPAPAPLQPATGIALGEVALYQGVKVSLYTAANGQVTKRNAPIIQGRDALLRVFFAPKPDWQPHRIAVRVTLQPGQGEAQVLEIQGTPGGVSTDEDLNSSANFDIPAALLDGTLSLRVELLDVEAGQGDTSGSAWPVEGFQALEEKSAEGNFKLRVYPIRYDADGSGRLPDLGEERQKAIRHAFLKRYPIPGIELELGEEIPWTSKVSANGSGWQSLLQKLVNLRAKEKRPNVYYYGLFLPTNSLASFCIQGCVAGLTLISPGTDDPSLRASIGLGYNDEMSLNTILHEVGHAHRRTHAPCGPFGQLPDQIDPKFPYKTGKIGVWGYDLLDRTLKDPAKFFDFMGYCDPNWVSDYTFNALFQRVVALNNQAAFVHGNPTRWRQAWFDLEGELRWGDIVERTLPPVGEELTVSLGEGPNARQVKGYFHGMSHLPGGLLLLPEDVGTPDVLDAGREGRFYVRGRP